jgi:hypothetical protein
MVRGVVFRVKPEHWSQCRKSFEAHYHTEQPVFVRRVMMLRHLRRDDTI